MHASSEPEIEKPPDNENETSISDAETQSSNDNDVEVEPAVDLDNPQTKNKRYDKRDFIARNTVKKENRGFKNLCLFHPIQLKRKMMKNLNALLKC